MLEKLNQEYSNQFSKSDHTIMDCLLRNENELQYLSTEELATKLGVSLSTISRFWKKIGFNNIKDFKNYLRESAKLTPASKISVTLEQWNNDGLNLQDLAHKYYLHLEKTLKQVKPEVLEKVAEKIIAAPKVYMFAPDGSLGLAEILIYRLTRLGVEFIMLKGGSAIYESMINLSRNDLVLMFSYSRLLSEIEILLKHSRIASYDTVLFTDLMTSRHLELAGTILYSYRGEPNEYHSMIPPLALIDLLILKIAQVKENSLEKMKYLETIREMYRGIIKR